MRKQDKILMAEYGITSSSKTMYLYKEYRYERLSDALSYAKSAAKRNKEGAEPTAPA
jgi:hypothetical protein